MPPESQSSKKINTVKCPHVFSAVSLCTSPGCWLLLSYLPIAHIHIGSKHSQSLISVKLFFNLLDYSHIIYRTQFVDYKPTFDSQLAKLKVWDGRPSQYGTAEDKQMFNWKNKQLQNLKKIITSWKEYDIPETLQWAERISRRSSLLEMAGTIYVWWIVKQTRTRSRQSRWCQSIFWWSTRSCNGGAASWAALHY